MTDLRFLGNEKAVKPTRIKLAALTEKDWQNCPELRKYFFANNTCLDRFHIPEISAEEYEEIANTFTTTSRFNLKNLKYDTASEYYIRKARVIKVARDLGVSPNLLDATDYIWDERYYTEYSFYRNIDVVDDAWRNKDEDFRNFSSHKVYIEMDAQNTSIDMSVYDALYGFCYKAIVIRKAMLLCKVDKCISFLQSIVDYTNGFSQNVTSAQKATLQSYLTFFAELLQDEEASKYIAGTNDIEVFANNEETRQDYIETYRLMLKGLAKCRNEDLEMYRTDMSQVEDPYIDKILENTIDFDDCLSEAYIDSKA